MNDAVRFASVLANVAYPGLAFELATEAGIPFLRVICDGIDSRTGAALHWAGRKWRLSEHMLDGEIVQTAWLAVHTALEHEARERFTFAGRAVFGPHYDIHALVALCDAPGAVTERSAT